MIAWVGAALAGSAESETLAQVRHDFFGERQVPVATTLRLVEDGAYADLQAALRLDHAADLDLHVVSASSRRHWGHWGLGRQLVHAPLRPQLIDGARLGWRQGGLSVEAWGGLARHLELDDLREGTPTGRVQAGWASGSVWTRAGATVDEELRGDLEVLARTAWPGRPSARALLISAPTQPTALLRAELGASPVPRLRVTAHAQHREPLDGPTGEALLATFAPEGADEVGLGLRWSNASWSSLAGSYALGRHEEQGQPVLGHAVDLSWTPPRSDRVLRPSPAYRYRSGPGGQFHAVHAAASVSLGDRRELRLHGAVVPYQKLDEPWDTAWVAGLEGRQRWRRVELRLGAEAAADATFALDVRASGALILRWP